jgi:hypothetical protein
MSDTAASRRRSGGRRKALGSCPDGHDNGVDHLFDVNDGIDALREIDWEDEEEDR